MMLNPFQTAFHSFWPYYSSHIIISKQRYKCEQEPSADLTPLCLHLKSGQVEDFNEILIVDISFDIQMLSYNIANVLTVPSGERMTYLTIIDPVFQSQISSQKSINLPPKKHGIPPF